MDLYKLCFCLSCFRLILSTNSENKLNISHSNMKIDSNINNNGRRIFEGEYVNDIKTYPFMALMKIKIDEIGSLTCGGSIISPLYILTAAHCVVDNVTLIPFAESIFSIFVGTLTPENTLSLTIKALYVHPLYAGDISLCFKCISESDIALLELDQPLEFNETISNVELPEPLPLDFLGDVDMFYSKTTKYTNIGKICKVLGWGKTNESDETPFSDKLLKETEVPLISIQYCNDLQPLFCVASQICSLDPNNKTGVCEGDSGGPLICDGVQVGIVSHVMKKGCVGPNLPNVYTRVDVYMKFINDVMSGDYPSKSSGCSNKLLQLLNLLYLICFLVIRLL